LPKLVYHGTSLDEFCALLKNGCRASLLHLTDTVDKKEKSYREKVILFLDLETLAKSGNLLPNSTFSRWYESLKTLHSCAFSGYFGDALRKVLVIFSDGTVETYSPKEAINICSI